MALLNAFNANQIGAWALDVGRAPDQMPSVELGRRPRVIATQQIGGLTLTTIERRSLETVVQVQVIFRDGCRWARFACGQDLVVLDNLIAERHFGELRAQTWGQHNAALYFPEHFR